MMRTFALIALAACASHEAPTPITIAQPVASETPRAVIEAPDASPEPIVEQGVTMYTNADEPPQGPCTECVQVSGSLVPEVIVRIIHLNRARFRFCYANALRKAPSLSGRVAIRFLIKRTGEVGSVTALPESTITDTDFRACLTDAFGKLQFPQPEGGEVAVTYPMLFTPKR
jgi:hypothetical protein